MIRSDIKQAIDQMCIFHGKTLYETHGLVGIGMSQRMGIEKWDKNHEFKVWVEQSKTGEIWYNAGRNKQTDEEWSEIDSYARKKGIFLLLTPTFSFQHQKHKPSTLNSPETIFLLHFIHFILSNPMFLI